MESGSLPHGGQKHKGVKLASGERRRDPNEALVCCSAAQALSLKGCADCKPPRKHLELQRRHHSMHLGANHAMLVGDMLW